MVWRFPVSTTRLPRQSWIMLLALAPTAIFALDSKSLEEVRVTARRYSESAEPTEQTNRLLNVPGAMGDPLQAIYSLPGVVQTKDTGGAPAVRGSGPDDNTFLIDFLPVSYIFHDFGNSIFDDDLIRDFGLKTAGYGARYDKATGAVFDVRLRDPRNAKPKVTVESSFLRASALVESRITDNQAFYVSYRESLIHLFLPLLKDKEQEKKDDTQFEGYPRSRDFQAKYVWDINSHNQLSLLTLGAQDTTAVKFGSNSDTALVDPGATGTSSIDTRFASQGIKWDYNDAYNKLETAAGYLRESRRDRLGSGNEYLDIDIDQLTFKSHYDRRLTSNNTLAAGVALQQMVFKYGVRARYRSCSRFSPECGTDRGELTTAKDDVSVNTQSTFLEDRITLPIGLTFTAGVRGSHNRYLQETHIEPRASFEWQLPATWNIHGSWGHYHQLPEIGQIIPVFGNPQLRSPRATHYVLGAGSGGASGWSWNTDVYYKSLDRLAVDVADGTQYQNLADGKAYGAELMITRNPRNDTDRWNGWFTLSGSRTQRFNNVTHQTTRFDYDTPVVANLVADYRFAPRWQAGMRWNFRSGYPYTPIVGNRENPDFPGYYLPVYGPLNSERAAAYHRLDLRVEHAISGTRFKGSYFFDLINVYARKNGGSVVYKPVARSSEYKLEEEKSLPFIPSIGIKLSFQ